LDHPAIVQVLAHDRDGEDLYTVLELINGPDLCEQLARSGPLPWRRVVALGVQIADALDAVHRQGLVHRDVKPANIMLTDDERVKLIDFGIVRITENYRVPTGAIHRPPTETGTALGTPGFLPLEAGLATPTPSFDVYGLGATLYQLLTGKLPGLPLQSLREAHAGCDAPDDLDRVLAAALALEPEDRTQTAAELGRALAAVRAAHPEPGAPSVRIDGRYELIGLVGTGAKADAHLAVHRGAGHDVVLKFLRSDAPDDVLRFAREATLLQTFDHPALPRFYDYALAATPPYIAMAHAPGRPAARLCSPPRLGSAEVTAIAIKLAQVLAMVHARGVLHRDINANNVIIDEHGAVTLIDFGCAELTEKFYDVPADERRYLTPPEARVTIPDGGIGRLAWSAPEVQNGKGWTDRSDVYSMGHLLFRLLTGKVPTKGADPPTSPLEFARECSEDLASAIVGALRIDPHDRPSAAQFAETLMDALAGANEVHGHTTTSPADGPLLRPVPAPPRVSADGTEHPIPGTSSAVIAGPRRWPRTMRTAALGALALGLTWWAGRMTNSGDAPKRHPDEVLASSDANLQSERVSQPSPPTLPLQHTQPPMRDVLDRATGALRSCSRLTGRLLILEFSIREGSDTFDSVVVSGLTSSALDHCVREATADLHFQPQSSETFNKEYTP
jgi:serine/threonine protein kinase